MNLIKDIMYKVKPDHPHWPDKIGRFQFLGGPERDVIVLSQVVDETGKNVDDSRHLFAVGLEDLVDFRPEHGDKVYE